MAEHKHAAVLRAIADKGFEAAQFWPFGSQINKWCVATAAVNPLTHPELEWRIKPEPKPDVVRYVNAYAWSGYANIEDAESMRNKNAAGMFILTFDGETGRLKSAEVLP